MYVTIRQYYIEGLDEYTPIVNGPFAHQDAAWQWEADRLDLEGKEEVESYYATHPDSFEVTCLKTPERVSPEHGDDWGDVDDQIEDLIDRALVAAAGVLERGIDRTKSQASLDCKNDLRTAIEYAATQLSRTRLDDLMERLAWEHELMEAYPKLYGNLRGNHFECGPGWKGLLKEAGEKLELPEDFDRMVIVKEKFGSLRIQGIPLSEQERDIIHDITERSTGICKTCGRTEDVEQIEWGGPRCHDCRQEDT